MGSTIVSYLQAGHTEFCLPKLFSKYCVNNFEKHLAQSYQVLYTDVILCKLSCKHISMFQNKTHKWTNCSKFTSCGRWQDAKCLEPARWMPWKAWHKGYWWPLFPPRSILSWSYFPHPNPVDSGLKFTAGKRTFRPTLPAQLRLDMGTDKCLSTVIKLFSSATLYKRAKAYFWGKKYKKQGRSFCVSYFWKCAV